MTIQTEYVIDAKGHKKSVVMPIKNFKILVEYIEDLEDAVDLKKAKHSGKSFIAFDDFAKQLKARGRIR